MSAVNLTLTWLSSCSNFEKFFYLFDSTFLISLTSKIYKESHGFIKALKWKPKNHKWTFLYFSCICFSKGKTTETCLKFSLVKFHLYPLLDSEIQLVVFLDEKLFRPPIRYFSLRCYSIRQICRWKLMRLSKFFQEYSI